MGNSIRRKWVNCVLVTLSFTLGAMVDLRSGSEAMKPFYMLNSLSCDIGSVINLKRPTQTCVERPLKNRQNKDLDDKRYSSLMKVESVAEWSPWSFLQYF